MKQSRLAQYQKRLDLPILFLTAIAGFVTWLTLPHKMGAKNHARYIFVSECYHIHTSPTTIPSSISSWKTSTCNPSQTTQNGSVDMSWVSGSTAWLVLLFFLFFSNLNILKHLCPEHQEPSEEQLWNPEALTAPPNKAHGSTL